MELPDLLEIRRGLTALIGGGGKTTLMLRLARELQKRGSVIVTTSTKIRIPTEIPVLNPQSPEELRAILRDVPLVCVCGPGDEGKLTAPVLSFEDLCDAADYVLVEADGSRGLPAKAHAAWEPVIPVCAEQTVYVVGASCFGRPIRDVCHRPELFASIAGCALSDCLTPERLAKVILTEGYGDRVLVNQAEDAAAQRNARQLAQLLPMPLVCGSLHQNRFARLERRR